MADVNLTAVPFGNTSITLGISTGSLNSVGTTGVMFIYQSFIAIGSLSSITFSIQKVNNPTNGLVITITPVDGSHIPTGAAIGSPSTIVLGSSLTTTSTPRTFTFNPPVSLVPGTEYAALVTVTDAGDNSNNYYVAGDFSNPYSAGFYGRNVSGNWTILSGTDLTGSMTFVPTPKAFDTPILSLNQTLSAAPLTTSRPYYGQYAEIVTTSIPIAYQGLVPGQVRLAQTITPTRAAFTVAFEVQARKIGNPTDSITSGIYFTSGGLPTTLLYPLVSVPASQISANTTTLRLSLGGSSILNTSQLAVVIGRSGAVDGSNTYEIAYGVDAYSGGTFLYDNGTAWTSQNLDMGLKLISSYDVSIYQFSAPPLAVSRPYIGKSLPQFSVDVPILGTTQFGVSFNLAAGQTFIPSSTITINSATIWLHKQGNPSDSAFLSISTVQPGTDIPYIMLGQSIFLPGSLVPTVSTLTKFNFSSPITLNAGTKYAIYAQRTGGINDSNLYLTAFGSPDYASGTMIYYDTSWKYYSNDMPFFFEAVSDVTLSPLYTLTANPINVIGGNSFQVSSPGVVGSNATVIADQDGYADLIREDNIFAQHYASGSVGTNIIPGSVILCTADAKPAGRNWLYLGLDSSTYVVFDLTTGSSSAFAVVPGSVSFEFLDNGYARCSFKYIAQTNSVTLFISPALSNVSVSYQGNGSSGVYVRRTGVEVLPDFRILRFLTANALIPGRLSTYTGQSGANGYGTSSTPYLAQTFIATGSSIKSLNVLMKATGTPVDQVYFTLSAVDASHLPTGPSLGTSNNVTVSGNSVLNYTFVLNANVTPGTEYAIISQRTGATDASNYFGLGYDTSDNYKQGTALFHNGTVWGNFTGVDFALTLTFQPVVISTADLVGSILTASSLAVARPSIGTSGLLSNYNFTSPSLVAGGSAPRLRTLSVQASSIVQNAEGWADLLREDTTNADHFVAQQAPGILAGSLINTWIDCKPAGRNWLIISYSNGSAYFNISTGALGANPFNLLGPPQIKLLDNGYYRCSIQFRATFNNPFFNAGPVLADNSAGYSGDGVSGIYVRGFGYESPQILQITIANSFAGQQYPVLSSPLINQTQKITAAPLATSSPYIGQSRGNVVINAAYVAGISFGSLDTSGVLAGQTFTPTSTFTLGTVEALLEKLNSPTDSVFATIQATTPGTDVATGPILSQTDPILGSSLLTTFVNTSLKFSPVTLNAGSKYAIVFQRTGAQSGTNLYSLGLGAPSYSSGTAVGWNGSSWIFYSYDAPLQLNSPADVQLIINLPVANALATQISTRDNPLIFQNQVLPANALTTQSVFKGNPLLSTSYTFISNNLGVARPYIPSVPFGQMGYLLPDIVSLQGPFKGTPLLKQYHQLLATPFIRGTNSLDTPVITQYHTLVSNRLSAQSVVLDPWILRQLHGLVPNSVATHSPFEQAPSFVGKSILTAQGISTKSIFKDTPILRVSLFANFSSTQSPNSSVTNFSEKNRFTSSLATIGTTIGHSIGTPLFAGNVRLTPNSLASKSGFIEKPRFDQVLILSSPDIATQIVIGRPLFISNSLFTANSIAPSSTLFYSKALNQLHILKANPLSPGRTALQSPSSIIHTDILTTSYGNTAPFLSPRPIVAIDYSQLISVDNLLAVSRPSIGAPSLARFIPAFASILSLSQVRYLGTRITRANSLVRPISLLTSNAISKYQAKSSIVDTSVTRVSGGRPRVGVILPIHATSSIFLKNTGIGFLTGTSIKSRSSIYTQDVSFYSTTVHVTSTSRIISKANSKNFEKITMHGSSNLKVDTKLKTFASTHISSASQSLGKDRKYLYPHSMINSFGIIDPRNIRVRHSSASLRSNSKLIILQKAIKRSSIHVSGLSLVNVREKLRIPGSVIFNATTRVSLRSFKRTAHDSVSMTAQSHVTAQDRKHSATQLRLHSYSTVISRLNYRLHENVSIKSVSHLKATGIRVYSHTQTQIIALSATDTINARLLPESDSAHQLTGI
jgi:hypothetical protein